MANARQLPETAGLARTGLVLGMFAAGAGHQQREITVRLTKLGHACVRLQKNGASLVIDPGVWSGPDALTGAAAILITHEHPDHLDAAAVLGALNEDPGLQVWTNAGAAGHLAAVGDRVHVVSHGDTFTAAGFGVHVYGERHALIHRDIPVIPNTGFAVDGAVFHPGDALTVPEDRVETLLLPANAPWLKAGEMIDYARTVAPRRAYAIHDGLLNANGLGLMQNLMQAAAAPSGAEYVRLEPGTSVEISSCRTETGCCGTARPATRMCCSAERASRSGRGLAPAGGDREAAVAAEVLGRDLRPGRVLPPLVLGPVDQRDHPVDQSRIMSGRD